MTMMKGDHTYDWKPFSHIEIDPQIAGGYMERLREKLGGELTPVNLLEDARKKTSPLHAAFVWNDSKAAELYRLQQAGHIIRSLVVTVRATPKSEPKQLRAFVSVMKDEKPRYTSLAVAMNDKELRAQVVDRAWRELMQWRERYDEYRELARVCGLIERESKGRKAA